jgi:LCP family protein required for cell wall assembly
MRRYALLLILLLTVLAPAARAQDDEPTLPPFQEEATAVPEPTDTADIPAPMPPVDEGKYDIINVLLMGQATENPNNPGLTDSLNVISINRTVGTVSVVSIPRDLYVEVPGFGMNKINTAYYYGETRHVEGGGTGLLRETVRRALGLNIDYTVRLNFAGFNTLIDSLGGIDITVDCTIDDWKLKDKTLDKHVAENYEKYTLRAGLYHMDSELALWYVRSRKTSSDLDRGRRQQDVMRAIWRKVRAQNLFTKLPDLWAQASKFITTDLTLADVTGLVPLALTMDTSDIEYYTFRQLKEVVGKISPAGQAVLVPQREAVAALMQQVVNPPSASSGRTRRPTVAIVNASGVKNFDRVAADRLELEGFRTVLVDEPGITRRFNHLIDYTGTSKGSPLKKLRSVLRVTDDGVEVTLDANRQYDYKVYIGWQYRFWSCTRDVIQPPLETPTPEATPGT